MATNSMQSKELHKPKHYSFAWKYNPDNHRQNMQLTSLGKCLCKSTELTSPELPLLMKRQATQRRRSQCPA